MLAITSSDPIAERFAGLREAGRRALVAYLTAGFPDATQSVSLLRGVAAAGADVIEVGVPFSDPMADGPVIQRASQVALGGGVGLPATLRIIREAQLSVPVVLFTYLNPRLAAGPTALAQARASGVHGVLVTDLPLGVDPAREAWLTASGMSFVRLVAPTTPLERMRAIAQHGGGFVYLISRLGVTGMRADVPDDLAETIARLRSVTALPICVGFGISTPAQAAAVGRLADGVVVGSALVRAAESSVQAAVDLTGELRAALDRA